MFNKDTFEPIPVDLDGKPTGQTYEEWVKDYYLGHLVPKERIK